MPEASADSAAAARLRRVSRRDVVIVGAGLAGLSAALYLAQRSDARVTVAARGLGAILVAPATVDVLGRLPGGRSMAFVGDPLTTMDALKSLTPEHPYSLVGRATLKAAIDFWRPFIEPEAEGSEKMVNRLLPTALGSVKPSLLVPPGQIKGDLAGGEPVDLMLVGLRGFLDFSAPLASANLRALFRDLLGATSVSALEVSLPRHHRLADRIDGVGLSSALDSPGFARALASSVKARLQETGAMSEATTRGRRFGFPAILGLSRHAEILEELRRELGAPVFEIPVAPPSVPGMRLWRSVSAALGRGGVELQLGVTARVPDRKGSVAPGLSIALEGEGGTRVIESDFLILASGGLESGGLVADQYTFREEVLQLPVSGAPPSVTARSVEPFFGGGIHPFELAGIRVDDRLRPLDEKGRPMYDNVAVAGGILAGAARAREFSGSGIAIATGLAAARAALARLSERRAKSYA